MLEYSKRMSAILSMMLIIAFPVFSKEILSDKLIEAVFNGDLDTLKNALAGGAEVNAISEEGYGLLHYAVESETPLMIRFLIENKADVNITSSEGGYTPLHLVSRKNFDMAKNRLEIAVILIAAGADINRSDESGATPLHMAVTGGLEELSRLLIEYGADVNKKTGYHKLTALHQAASGGHLKTVKLLIEKKADVNSRSAAGWTPLHAAKNTETAQILLDNGANINAMSEKGLTPLSEAVSKGDTELVRFLIEKGADFNIKYTNTSRTLLHYAASSSTAAFLVSLGMDVNAKDTWGYTPLHLAAERGDKEVAEYLILKGADMNAKITWFIRNDDYPIGSTPLDISLDNDPESALSKFLESKRAKTGRYLPGSLYFEDLGDTEIELFRAVRNGNLTIIIRRLKQGADINAVDNAGWTPLHWAAYFGRTWTAKYLIKNGAKINEQSKKQLSREYPKGQTPLDVAKAAGKEDIIKILTEAGAKRGTQG